jgi:hypothetical protein
VLSKKPDYLNAGNKVFIQLIKNLGPGLLRIGGNSSDEITWTGGPRTISTPADALATSDIDRLADFTRITGWPVLFGLNLGNNNVAAAADEAAYVQNSLKENLYALQAGNEPDVYSHYSNKRGPAYSYIDYASEWDAYLNAVRSKAPQTMFAGPDVSYNSDWITAFADSESPRIKLIDGHHYNTGPASNPSITYKNILAYNFLLPHFLSALQTKSAKYYLPFRITECNSVYGGGKFGVSDTFASALWALDFMWTVAASGGQGVNFHTLTWGAYSPVVFDNGAMLAKPEYYGMLAFKYGSTRGTIIPADINHAEYNCSAFACINPDNSQSLTLINKDDSNNFSFTVQPGKHVSTIQISRLSAPSITSTGGVTLGGNMVNADGTFKLGTPEEFTINKSSFVVNVPAGSAALVMIK